MTTINQPRCSVCGAVSLSTKKKVMYIDTKSKKREVWRGTKIERDNY